MRGMYLLLACTAQAAILFLFSSTAQPAELQAQTLEAWQQYVSLTEARIESELKDESKFLLTEFMSRKEAGKCQKEVAKGDVCTRSRKTLNSNGKKMEVPDGTISHWLGSIRVPNAKLEALIGLVQNYDVHERYFGDVEKSKLIERDGGEFKFFYRLKQKTSWITVYYNTTHQTKYQRHSSKQVSSASHTVRINELDNPGKDEEREKPEGQDNGFLWRLNSYWRFQQDEEGVVVTLESLTLSRDIPFWPISLAVKPIVDKISRGLLEKTLMNLRDGYHAYVKEVEPRSIDSGKASPEALQ